MAYPRGGIHHLSQTRLHKKRPWIRTAFVMAGVVLCAGLITNKVLLNRSASLSHQTTKTTNGSTYLRLPIVNEKARQEAALPPLPEPTGSQWIKGYENVAAALKEGGDEMLPLINSAARLTKLKPQTACALISTEASLDKDAKNPHSGASKGSQNTKDNRIDNTARHGRWLLPHLQAHNPKAAFLLKRLTVPFVDKNTGEEVGPFVGLSEGDRGKLIIDQRAYNALCERERQAVYAKCPLPPEPKTGAKPKELKAYRDAYAKATATQEKAMKPLAWLHKDLLQLISDLNDNTGVSMLFSFRDLSIKLDKVKRLVQEKNPQGRAAQLLADKNYGDDFLYKVIHNCGYTSAVRICLAPYGKPLLDILAGSKSGADPSLSSEANAKSIETYNKNLELARKTMANNGWPEDMTAGQFLDAKAVQMLCEKTGFIVCFDPDKRALFYANACAMRASETPLSPKSRHADNSARSTPCSLKKGCEP